MKKLTLLFISLFAFLTMFAGEVTEAEALQKAQQFMQGKQFKQRNLRRAPSADVKNNAYYVFNAEDGGFVIISGDDRTADILGYSETGVFDWGKAPSNVKWLLNFYKQFIDHLGTKPTQARPSDTPVSASNYKTIAPLVQTQWGQFAPYNNQCPELDGERCATGCVATAMAQIINYCKWPQEQTSTVAAYQTGTEKINMSQLSPTSFNWDNMQESDIARLMLYCGQSVQMDYGIVESGAMVEDAPFKEVFGYSKSARIISRDVMYSEWENILYDELSNSRPVLYKGGNHAWVIDGYKDGLFHMNWGWDGDLDGYYKITDLTEDDFVIKYEWNQSALIGIKPPLKAEDTDAKVIVNSMGFATEAVIDNIGYLKRTATSEDFPVVNISSELRCDLPSVQDVGIGLLDSKGVLQCFAQGQHDFSDEEQSWFSQDISFGKNLADGDYRLVAICRNGETGDWLLDIEANCSYIEVQIDGLDMMLHVYPDGTKSKDYRAVGVKEIDGVTYFLYYNNENYLATVYPYQISEKYAGKVIIPKQVELEGTTYRVFDENNAFTNCPELTSLTLNNSFINGIANCPKLTSLQLQEGVAVCYGISGLPILETIELPATLNWTMGNSFITNCEKLKTIRFKGTVFNIFYEPPKWDDSSLPALTDIYFPNTTPPLIIDQGTNEQITDIVPAHTKARIHIPVGSLPLYQQSNWKNWTFVEDMPAPSAVTWGYCHGDAVMNSGSGATSNSNYMEYAMRVPADKISVYKGAKITQIQLYSQWATRNDYHLEDYEYVYITKRGTDYIVKQPFNVVRGAWNTIELETPYTITGEEIFVGFGRYQGINVVYSDMTEVKDAAWGRAMGDDDGCIWEPGVWQKLGTRAHPLPLRFVIEGEGISEGVSVGELNIIESTSGEMSRKAPSTGIKLQATVRNMSLQPVSSYTLEWSVDGEVKGNKSYETYLVPNASEFVTLDLPASYSSDTHTISLDIKTVNGTSNELADKNVACMEVINGEEGVILTVKDCTREYGESNPTFEFTTKSDLSGELPKITCEADKNSPVGTYPIVIQKGSIDYDNVLCVDGTLTIEKALLTITAKDYTIKQGEPLPEFEATYDGFKNGETSSVLTKQPTFTTTATSASEPDEYDITISGAEAENYDISYINGKLTITKADPVTITAKSYTIKYGDDLPAFEYTSEGAEVEGTPSITCEATSTSPVGTYPIVISKGTVKNYNDTYVNGTLTIEKAPLKITAKDYTIKQGEALPTFEATYDGFKNDETEAVLTKQPTITTTATSASEPDEYDITISGAEAQNYEISYINGKLTIVDADALIITAKSYTIKYGDDLPAFEYTSDGAALEGTPEITCEATSTSPVGTYPIVISKGSVSNYNVTYVNGTLTIEKAPLKITAKDYTIKQGEPLPTFEATYDGFKNDETEAVLTKQPTITTTATSASEPGEYDITISDAEAQNYDISYVNGKLTITEADGILGISVEHPADVYDLQGNKVRSKMTTLKDLSKGVYIINGKKILVK